MRTTALLRTSAIALLLCGSALVAGPAAAQSAACEPAVVVDRPPPPLPVYEQPPIPGPGHIWEPGYWRWQADDEDYYWVPGVWTVPPRAGLLWTPGFWGWVGGSYLFHRGYWGSHVGFYGGVDYGHGYGGEGYEGGHWEKGVFFYNRSVNNLSGVHITNVYDKTVVVNRTVNNISFNGGKGGIEARPTAEQRKFDKENHFAPTELQMKHVEAAGKDKELFDKANHGKPPVAATQHEGDLKGKMTTPAGEPGKGEEPAHGAAGDNNPAANGLKPAMDQKDHPNAAGENDRTNGMKPAMERKDHPGAAGENDRVNGMKPAMERKDHPGAAGDNDRANGMKPAMERKDHPATAGDNDRVNGMKPAMERKDHPNAAGANPAANGEKPAMERKMMERKDNPNAAGANDRANGMKPAMEREQHHPAEMRKEAPRPPAAHEHEREKPERKPDQQ